LATVGYGWRKKKGGCLEWSEAIGCWLVGCKKQPTNQQPKEKNKKNSFSHGWGIFFLRELFPTVSLGPLI